MDFFSRIVEQFIRENRKLKRWQRAISLLSALVVFTTTYALVLPAITLDKETASAQSGIEISASGNEPESDGTAYEAEPEEESAEEQQEEEDGEPQADGPEEPQDAEAAAEESDPESESRDAEVSEEDHAEEDAAADHGQNTEEQAGSEEAEDPSDEEDTAPDAAEDDTVTAPAAETLTEGETLEEIKLITEETQLTYEYIDEYYADGIEDENDDGIDDGYFVCAEFGADAKLPEGVELSVKEITKESDPEVYEAYYEKALSGLQDKYDEKTALSFARFYDIKFIYNGEEVEPSGDVKVRIEYKKAVEIENETTVDAVYFDKDNDEGPEVIRSEVEAEENGRDDTVKTVEFESDRFSVYGIVGSYTAEQTEGGEEIRLITEETQLTYEYTDEKGIDDGYIVYAEFGADAKLPEGVELIAEEITKESDPEVYEAYYEKALSGLQDKYDENTALSFARFYDIRFIYNGKEVEPAGDVKIRIEYKKAVEIEKETAVDTVHFDKNNGEEPEVIESEVNRTEAAAEEEGKDDTVKAVEFESAQFSVYGIIGSYTVDFRWEVDGKTYDFSLPGGGFVSFTDLVEVLGLTGDANSAENDMEAAEESDTEAAALMLDDIAVSEETRKFVADVASVEFSSPELVWVGKVENDSTVSELREAYGLVSFISGEPTEEQIAEINAQTVEAGDWAIISLVPFTSEEALTVTMKNGERFAISVTDGQEVTSYSDVDRDGFYIIYVDNVIRHWSGPFYYWDEHQYYALRKDGASVRVENNDLDALGNEFLWRYDFDEHACWWYNGSNYIEPEWSMVVGSDPNGRYLWVDQRWDGAGFDIHGDSWSNNYLSWDDQNGFIIAYNNSVPIRIYEREKPIYNFKVETNNENYGSVSCQDTVTDNDFKNAYDIIAAPANDCYFVGWHLGDSILSPDEYGSTIPAGALAFPEDGMTLTAVFGKNYTSPATQEINEWVDSLLGNPLESDKTAHVHDYDNRIYEIDLSASSSRYTIDQDIRIEFITDISRSMYFPETLLNEQDFRVNGQINLGQWLLNNGDPEQVYYVIGDINNTATMYAVYFSGNEYFTRWSIVDASYYLPYDGASTSGRIKRVCQISGGNTTIDITDRFADNRIFTGKIYTSTPKPPKDTADWDRLSYLTAAVNAVSRAIYQLDPGAELGLVTFASSASGGTLYGADDEEEFITALHSIQPTGGTNHQKAFKLINESDPPVFTTNSGKRQVALLITDGAPQGVASTWERSWELIEESAGITEGNDVEIWTLGIALERVGNNKQKLMDLASDGGYSGNAEDPDQLVTETKKILQEMLVKASTIGEVYDTVDPAFYPVDASGDPIEAGFYYADTEGGDVTKHSAAPSDAAKPYYQWVDDNGTWKITYYNQEIKWPEDGGWKSSFYIKAKEDFMGGNTISTNSGVDNRIEVNRIKHSGPPEGYYWLKEDHSSFRDDFAMPYVNVDELSLTENSTEWTVYLGTEVDPATELKELWDQILVNQVVRDGEDDEVITITDKDQMYYSDELLNDAAAPDGKSNKTLPLSHFVNADIIDSLIQMLDNGETTATAMRSYRYFPYGHDVVGTFDIALTKTLTDDDAAEDHAPYEHETKETGDRREVYTLTVTYNPTNNDASDTYDQTTPGHTAGKVADGYDADTGELIRSKNTHIINVFAKKLQLLKVDQSNQTITGGTGAAAEFGLYRVATAEEEADDSVTKVPLSGLTGNYVLVQSLTTENGTVTTDSLSLVKGQEPYDEPYYLVETKAPDGYLALEEPLKVSIDLEDHNTWGRYTATTEYSEGETYYVFNEETYEYEEADIGSQADITGSDVTVFRFVPRSQSKPDPYELSDWLQEAAVIVTALDGTDSSAAIRVIPEGQHGITYDHTDDTTDASVEYMIVNNAGCKLPSTGGPGTNLIYLLGIMFTGIAGAGLLMRRKKKAA